MRSTLACLLALAIPFVVTAGPAAAQTLEEEMMETEAQDGGTGTTGTGGTGTTGTGGTTASGGTTTSGGAVDDEDPARMHDEQALLEEQAVTEATDDGISPGERHDESYFFLGAFARAQVVPQFIQNLFVAEGATPVNGGFGLYFNWRKNGFNVQVEAFYQGMGVDGYYRGNGDPDTEVEFVSSRLGVVMGYIGFGWAFDLTDWFAIELGFGLGFGGVVGDLYRQEAHRDTLGGLQTCRAPGQLASGAPAPADGYCELPVETVGPNGRLDDTRTRGGTYQLSTTGPSPHYFGDGGVPPVFFTIDLPRVSFRFKPIRQIQIRIDGAYNLYGFSFGGGVAYGF